MAIHNNHYGLVLLQMIFLLSAIKASEHLTCPDRCGDVVPIIEYPLGIGEGCYFDKSYEVVCDNSSGSPKAVLKSINLTMSPVYQFDSSSGAVAVNVTVIALNSSSNVEGVNMTGTPFSFSQSENTFTATGCNHFPKENKQNDSNSKINGVGCYSICTCDPALKNGCCHLICDIPPNTKVFDRNTSYIYPQITPPLGCTSVLVVIEDWLFDNYWSKQLVLKDKEQVPAVLEWAKYRGSCYEQYGSHSSQMCNKDKRCLIQLGSGFYCHCRSEKSYDFCDGDLLCNITSGYNCSECPHGYNKSDYNSNREPQCSPSRSRDSFIKNSGDKLIVIGCTSGGLGMFILLTGAWRLHKFVKRRRKIKLKKKFFKRNGGLLLQKELASKKGHLEKTKLFTSKELEMATDNFNTNRMLGQGGQGTVYKGMLSDGKIVAVKKSIVIDESKVDEFINEVVMLSQINHRNVVKLLGCCLETEVPLLVYEFVHNGTLFQYIHNQQNEQFPDTWEMRLRIAVEVSGAVSYLHSAASLPIYHRDIKSTNILLDEKYRAKVSDFGASRSMAIDQTHMTTKVHGTFGYFDPEYFRSSQFTEKSDVYSFGVVLAELLTGEKPIRSTNSEEDKSLAIYFLNAMKEDRLFEILDTRVLKEEDRDEIMIVAKLAKRCLNLKGIKRPTMKEVATELAGIRGCKSYSNFVQESLEEVDSVNGDIERDFETDVSISYTMSVSVDADPFIRITHGRRDSLLCT